MIDSRETRRIAIAFALGVLGFLMLPVVSKLSSATRGPLALRALIVACIVGLIGAKLSRKWLVPALALASTFAGSAVLWVLFRHSVDAVGLAIALALAPTVSVAIAAAARSRWPAVAEVAALIIVLLVSLAFAGLLPGVMSGAPTTQRAARLAQSPQPYRYSFDGDDFIRAYQLMKQGTGYYTAFRLAVTQDSRHNADYMQSPFNYREPLVFEIWPVLGPATCSCGSSYGGLRRRSRRIYSRRNS